MNPDPKGILHKVTARLSRSGPELGVLAAYLVVALVMTWPLARGLARDLPQDLADPVLNCWILGWVTDQLTAVATGDLAALGRFWDANIFDPEPRALAYSEHLLAQSIMVLPLRWSGAGLVLCYNLVFLSTFVLSGFFMFLLVRDLTGSRRAAFVAGLLYGFAPYRMDQLAHVQVLSSQWMPLALLWLRRYVAGGRPLALAAATGALAAQGLSCGYYLLFFSPFAAAFTLHELAARDRLRDPRRWLGLTLAACALAAVVIPFFAPYVEVRRAGAILRERWEVEQFAADVYAYASAPEALRLWGGVLRLHPGPESSLFPGFVPLALALVGLGAALRRLRRGGVGAGAGVRQAPRLVRVIAWLAGAAAAFYLAAFLLALLGRGFLPDLLAALHLRSARRLLLLFSAASLVCMAAAPRVRLFALAFLRSVEGFAALAALAAAWLSLGPRVRSMGEAVAGLGLYGWLYDHVPGFDGVRVPARFAMVVALFLAVLAGYGALLLTRRLRLAGLVLVAAAFLAESWAAPIPLNGVWGEGHLASPPSRALLGRDLPAIYRQVQGLPQQAVLAEFPFGSYPYELHFMLYSSEHRRRLVNGFSGGVPASYRTLRRRLAAVLRAPDDAWTALAASTATHVVVHERAFRGQRGPRVTAWLEAHGARILARAEGDVLLVLPARR